jgi:hypothetical protein
MTTPVVLLSALVSGSTPEESGLKVHFNPVLDRAAEIAVADIRSCITPAGFRPDSSVAAGSFSEANEESARASPAAIRVA